MSTTGLGPRWRHVARVLRAETTTTRGARRALNTLLDYTAKALASSGYDAGQLSPEAAGWAKAVEANIVPPLETLFTSAFKAAARGTIDPGPYAIRHLEAVTNRLAGVPDEVFDLMRGELALGREAQESIPQLAARVDTLLRDGDRWKNRATLIARTEVIGANNAGGFDASRQTARALGVDESLVVCEWLATSDGRTRPTHADADGQQVLGIDAMFSVGGYELAYPGDPNGPAEEVCNCRCTALYHMPGDAGYPEGLTASATLTAVRRQETTMAEDNENTEGACIVALPAAGEAVYDIGDPEQHATLLYLGDAAEVDGDLSEVASTVATIAAGLATFTETVTGVESLGDDGARVWMLTGDTLTGIHAALRDDPTLRPLYDAVEQFPEFTAHETIGYAPEGADEPGGGPSPEEGGEPGTLDQATEEAAAAVESITYDRLAVWWGTSRSEFPLGGEAPEEEPMDASTETVAGGVLDAFARHLAGEDVGPEHRAAIRARLEETFQGLSGHASDTLQAAPLEPGEAPAGGPALAQDIPADGAPWYGILCPEDVMSGDARSFAPGSITWRDLPLPLMFQDAQAIGHDGAVRVGRIDSIERDESGPKPMIRATGVWDTSEVAAEAQRQVAAQVLRGVSVDCDAVTVQLEGSDGQPLDPMVDDFPEDGVVVENATEARIAGATLCSIPAFHQAYVANGTRDPDAPEPGMAEVDGEPVEPAVADETVTASAWVLTASADPALVWSTSDFTNPGLTEPTCLTVTDDGRVYGHLAVWGVCHIGIDGICQEPPASATNYAYFATGSVPVEDGMHMPVGALTMETGHAAMNLRHRAAAAHYDNTGTAVAYVTMGQDGIGIWFAGRVAPGTTPEQVFAMRAAGSVSGDWREIGGNLELVAGLVCNVPGFPIPAASVAASGGHATAMVASGVVRRPQDAPNGTGGGEGHRNLVDAVEANLALRSRARAAQMRVRTQRAATARRRFQMLQAAENANRVAAAAARLERV